MGFYYHFLPEYKNDNNIGLCTVHQTMAIHDKKCGGDAITMAIMLICTMGVGMYAYLKSKPVENPCMIFQLWDGKYYNVLPSGDLNQIDICDYLRKDVICYSFDPPEPDSDSEDNSTITLGCSASGA